MSQPQAEAGGTGRPIRVAPFGDEPTFLQSVLESSTEYSIIAADLEGKILLWNEGARRIYGYSPEEILGRNVNLLVNREGGDQRVGEEARAIALQRGKWEGVITRRRSTGEMFPARVVETVLRDQSGEPRGFLVVSKDLTEDERLHQKLIESEEYNRGLIESNIDALMTTDPLGVITDVNRRVEELTGRSRDRLIGTPLKTYFADPARAEEAIRRVLAEDRVTNFESELLTAGGGRTIVAFNATTFRGADGKLRGVFASARDVTEQKLLESQLRESQIYNRGLIEASLDALITVDRAGNITDLNRQMEKATGHPREELVGSRFADYFTEPERAEAGLKETLDRGLVTNYELELKTA
ncbi:MAG: PAS domain S-box protein, partial [Thermoplasmata archaeon]|nr:PAS domain S-box protein [Thermoplasmata archaeon]